MKKSTLYLVSAFLLGLAIGLVVLLLNSQKEYTDTPKESLTNITDSFSTPVEKASPAVVNIYSEMLIKNNQNVFPFSNRFNSLFRQNRPRIESSLGSGVVFSSDGYVLTNQHVIGDKNLSIIIELSDGRKKEAKIIGIDKGTDLAVLKIDPLDENFPSIEIGNSDNLKKGDVVLAIGNPYGLGQSVSFGIVSATGREFNNPYLNYIQTDASINKGNSGGALIDTSGRLVGINTLIRSSSGGSEGVGLAIPSVTVLGIINDLIQFGEVKRGWLGFGIDRRSLAMEGILLINFIHPESPAKKASMKIGDIIIEINNKPSSYNLLYKELARSKPGDVSHFVVLRKGKNLEIELQASTPLN